MICSYSQKCCYTKSSDLRIQQCCNIIIKKACRNISNKIYLTFRSTEIIKTFHFEMFKWTAYYMNNICLYCLIAVWWWSTHRSIHPHWTIPECVKGAMQNWCCEISLSSTVYSKSFRNFHNFFKWHVFMSDIWVIFSPQKIYKSISIFCIFSQQNSSTVLESEVIRIETVGRELKNLSNPLVIHFPVNSSGISLVSDCLFC